MSNDSRETDHSDMLPEYDFTDGVQGKYAQRFAEGSNVVILSPDVAKEFTDSDSVNEALRSLIQRQRGKESA